MLRYAVLLALVLVSGVASRGRPSKRPNVSRPTAPPGTTARPFSAEDCNKKPFPKQCKQSPLEISFIVDASSSIGKLNFVRCMNFIEDFAGHFKIAPDKVRMSMVTFAKEADASNAFDFEDYTDLASLKTAIANTRYTEYQWTNTSAGIWYMLDNQADDARNGIRHVVIVITDGRSQETSKTNAASQDLHDLAKTRGNMEIIAVGVGRSVHYPELATIAGNEKNVFEVESYELLESLTERLIFQSCDVPIFPACKLEPVELGFVIDSSASIGDVNFALGMDFVKSFASQFRIDQDHVRMAAVTFDVNANPEQAIEFDDYIDGQGLTRQLEAVNYTAGSYTNTGEGILYMAKVLMPKARKDTAKICIVLTDGNSQEWQKTEKMAQDARDLFGITMYAIGVGDVDQNELNRIAGDVSRTKLVEDYEQLNTFKDQLLNITCDAAMVHLASQGPGGRQG